ncbi:MAG: hypothetical protein ACLP1D_10325 [Xanthobacteraceae bacterium]
MTAALHLVPSPEALPERRTCRKCGEEKDRAEGFPKAGRICNVCVAARTKAWRAADPLRATRTKRECYARHRDEVAIKSAEYYVEHRKAINARLKDLYRGPKGDQIRAACAEYRDANRSEIAARQIRWRRENVARELLRNAKSRASKLGLEFDITIDDVFVPAWCPVLGIPLFVNPEERSGACPNSPTLDRIDNLKGYVRGNVAVISWRANRLKSDGSLEEHELVTAWLRAVITEG